MVRRRRPPSATWRTFLKEHVREVLAIDFLIVPTVRHRLLFVFLVLAHHRRGVLHFNVTDCPTTAWTAQQLVEALPWDSDGRRFLLRDRDRIYGARFRRRVDELGLEEVLTAPRCPWQSPYAERLIGSIRRECLDRTLVLGERHLKRVLAEYFRYYHRPCPCLVDRVVWPGVRGESGQLLGCRRGQDLPSLAPRGQAGAPAKDDRRREGDPLAGLAGLSHVAQKVGDERPVCRVHRLQRPPPGRGTEACRNRTRGPPKRPRTCWAS